jgi:cytochrome c-type biogenesis protein CcmH
MRRLLTALLVLVWVVPALALTPDELLKDPALEARARSLSGQLRCLVCQNQSIDDSDAPLAKDLRVLIRQRLTQGDSDRQVMDFVVSRYGDFVLLKPRFTLKTLLLWATPFVVLLAAALAMLMRRRPVTLATPERPLTDEERQALEKALE